MRLTVIGAGYVGLVTGATLASHGHTVICVDRLSHRVAAIASGNTPMHEPGLPALVAAGVEAGRLTATTDLAAAVAGSDVVMLCVGTPPLEDGTIDLASVIEAAEQTGMALGAHRGRPVVAVKSTVVPGTTGGPVRAALERASGLAAGRGFGLAANPEFLSQGSAVSDSLVPDRIVIGGLDDFSSERVAAIYDGFACPVLRVGLADAEMIKYAANTLQAMLISFSNQIAALCEATPGADERRVMEGVHLARMLDGTGGGRAGAVHCLRAGIGFGGSCLPKDIAALAAFARQRGVDPVLIDAVLAVNLGQPARVTELVERTLGGLQGRHVAVLGLTFKPHTDDLRESPSFGLIAALAGRGASVRAHDPLPQAVAAAETRLGGAAWASADIDEALAGADAAILATAWPEYRALNWAQLATRMRRPLVFDGRDHLTGLALPSRIELHRIGLGDFETRRQPEGAVA